MRNLAILILVAAVAAPLCSCKVRYRDDDLTAEFSVPGLAGPECSRELLAILSRTGGVLEASPDVAGRSVSVTFNSRVTHRVNIEHAIAAGGFDVNETPADPAAREKLPETCR